MGELTQIGWTDHTFNLLWGCTKVPGDPACEHCYAESYAKMRGFDVWGKDAPRRALSDEYWKKPLKWNEAAKKDGKRHLVFTSSMADVYEENRPDVEAARERLFELIPATPFLTWQVLTKRPHVAEQFHGTRPIPDNVWMGVTAVTKKWMDVRLPILLRLRDYGARTLFVSAEPLMEDVGTTLRKYLHTASCELMDVDSLSETCTCRGASDQKLSWVIVGGESGGKRRPMDPVWLRNVVSVCVGANVPCFVKQDSAQHPGKQGRISDEIWSYKGFPA